MLIASRDIPLKSHVFTIPNPLLAVVDNAHLKEVCYECFTAKGRWDWTTRQNGTMNKKEFLVCTGCGVARYCDKVSLFFLNSGSRSNSCFSGGYLF